KCLGKMDEVSQSGRTVLFVSHNMEAVKRLCTKGVLLVKGQCKSIGPIEDVIEDYLEQYSPDAESATVSIERDKIFNLWTEKITILADEKPSAEVKMGESIAFDVQFASDAPVKDVVIGFVVSSLKGEKILNANNVYQPYSPYTEEVSSGVIRCQLGQAPLMPGRYQVSFWVGNSIEHIQRLEEILTFEVFEQDIWGKGKLPPRNASTLWWNTDFEFLSPILS
ncbi:MAG: Wzt carbohydrate-binding domain-containing protein, partial [Bacteroidia bacterium]